MNNDEILELGEDGSFEITSTLPVKQDIANQQEILYTSIHIDEVEDDNDEKCIEKQHHQELLTNMKAGEYKIYKENNNSGIFIIVKLCENDNVTKVGYLDKEIYIHTKLDSKYIVTLKEITISNHIDTKSGTCSTYQEYVTINYNLLL